MSDQIQIYLQSQDLPQDPLLPLQEGERPVDNAPRIRLGNGLQCIPQHYLHYHHSRASVERVICDVDYSDRYPIFVSEDQGGIYIQVGIIGVDNYAPSAPPHRQKIVYGRRWRVEPNLPTSEIIQTAFLALKKAREHEVRELFRLRHNGRVTTPFNCHQDLPLIAQNIDLVKEAANSDQGELGISDIKAQLQNIVYDGTGLILKSLEKRGVGAQAKWILDIDLCPSSATQLPEITARTLTFFLDTLNLNALLFQLMDEFLKLSNQHVDEHFYYKSHPRFSRSNNIFAVADLSSTVRKIPDTQQSEAFTTTLETLNYETDTTRVPRVFSGPLCDKLNVSLARYDVSAGILPDL